MRNTIAITAAGLAAAAALGLAGPAQAESIGVTDPDDISHGVDLRSVEVRHGERAVVVTTTHDNLRRTWRSGSGGAIYLDTDPADRGPEYVFVGGFFEGTDYSLLETEGFGHRRWGEPAEGFWIMKADYDTEHVRFRMSRRALGNPDEVRVSVRVSGTRSDGTSAGIVDWLGEPRSFTQWVAQG
jgi:hypothetical protein